MNIAKQAELNSIVTAVLKNIYSELYAMQDDLAPSLSVIGQRKLDKTVLEFTQEINKLNEQIKDCFWA